MEKSLIRKLYEQIKTQENIELSEEELEILLRISELLSQIEILEATSPLNKELIIENNTNELRKIFKTKHFEGFEKHCFWFAP